MPAIVFPTASSDPPRTDFIATPWADDNGNQWLFTASPPRWVPYVEPAATGGNSITITGGTASASISGTAYYWPVFETNPTP